MGQHGYITPVLPHLPLLIGKDVNEMAFSYIYQTFMCRCNRATKLYANATDIMPTLSEIIEPGDMFLSERSVTIGPLVLYQISSSINGRYIPSGYWCPSEVLDFCVVEEEPQPEQEQSFDDSVSIDECFIAKSDETLIYTDKSGSSILSHKLKRGDRVFVDRKINTNMNGIMQTRYHIIGTTSQDKSVINAWVLESPAIEDYNKMIHKYQRTRTPAAPVPLDADDGDDTASETPDLDDMYRDRANQEIMDDAIKRVTSSASDLKELYDIYGLEYGSNTTGSSLMSIPIGRMIFVHGMPFQYTYITDRRKGATGKYGKDTVSTSGSAVKSGYVDTYGRTFAKEIAANMPIAVLVPGVPVYMTKAKSSFFGYKGSDSNMKGLWSPLWSDLTDSEYESAFNNLISGASGDYDYYSIQIDMTTYHKYVNGLTQNSAKLMGLQGRKFRGKDCTSFDWGKYNSAADQDYNTFEEVVGLSGGISFAYDPLSSVSDTITNSTAESAFAGTLTSLSSKAKELQFVAGQGGLSDLFNIEDYEASIGSIGASGFGGLVNRAVDFGKNAAKGFNIRFPEIWQDSSHTRSYDIDMHFITPYATAFCKWRYVLVPFFHLFALAAPQAPDNMSVYGRPFIIKAFSKGYFNVELGIIESLTWKRFGDGDMISGDGVPTQIDVTIAFKDMYHVLTMGHTSSVAAIQAFFNNTGLMDMLGTLSGVNMNRITIGERLSLYASSATNALFGIGTNFMRHFSDRTRRIVETYFVGL